MTPTQFLAEIAEPNVRELNANPTSVRHAWIAVTSLHHFEDYLAVARSIPVEDARKEIEKADPHRVELLRHVANSLKHAELDRGRLKGLSVRDMRIGSGAAFTDGSYYSDGTSHSDAPNVVRIEYGGELIDVPHLCRLCLLAFKRIASLLRTQ